MKCNTPLTKSLFATAVVSLCLPLCGCGGSSSGISGPTPNYTALFAPFLGTYVEVSTDPTDTADSLELIMTMGKGSRYGSSVPVIVASTSGSGEFMIAGAKTSEGKAYIRDATLSPDGTSITSLNIIYPAPSGTIVQITLSPSSTGGTFTGTLTDSTSEPPVGSSVNFTLASVATGAVSSSSR